MVEVKCTKMQYKMMIDALASSGLYKGKCFLRKDEFSCPSINGKNISCEECLEKHIKRIDVKAKGEM